MIRDLFRRSKASGLDLDVECEAMDQALREVSAGRARLQDDDRAPAVVISLFSLLARRTFAHVDQRVVTLYVAAIRSRTAVIGDDERLARLVEVVIRSELGHVELLEPRLGTMREIVLIMNAVAIDLLRESGMDEHEVGELVSLAESEADRHVRNARGQGASKPGRLVESALRARAGMSEESFAAWNRL